MSAILDGGPAGTASSARGRLPFTRAPVGLYAGSMAVVLLLAASSLLGLAASPSLYDGSPSTLVSSDANHGGYPLTGAVGRLHSSAGPQARCRRTARGRPGPSDLHF